MKYAAVLALTLLNSCATRKLPTTPAYLTLHVKAASCEMVPIASAAKVLGEVRYTVEDGKSIDVRRIEFRRAR